MHILFWTGKLTELAWSLYWSALRRSSSTCNTTSLSFFSVLLTSLEACWRSLKQVIYHEEAKRVKIKIIKVVQQPLTLTLYPAAPPAERSWPPVRWWRTCTLTWWRPQAPAISVSAPCSGGRAGSERPLAAGSCCAPKTALWSADQPEVTDMRDIDSFWLFHFHCS